MIILGVIISYLVGSIPTAYIFGKCYKGIDIRQHGSGNIGATNVFRVLGKVPGIIVLLLDILKGVVAVAFVADILGLVEIIHRLILALCVVSGHNWTIFLKFKGGKGIATSLGVLIGLTIKIVTIRPVLLAIISIWLICFLVSRIVSLSSIIAAIFLPIFMLITNQPIEIICLGVVFSIFVVVRHRPNIKRLFSGQEPRVPFFTKK
ncbi:Acyl-phosphate:glycerol-3-phosphate O-acyltransferase PlsY (EC 2.3.1.n3) [hydrothermal vent metagenome]|uniref:Acyl-phosphate:glycerol-3-phosphate O-acyltransferase PlsY n=1 Tax=hydrothermal vent metagenome TaxID=652676 RepID=A0A3B1DGL8_9ZZZZ